MDKDALIQILGILAMFALSAFLILERRIIRLIKRKEDVEKPRPQG